MWISCRLIFNAILSSTVFTYTVYTECITVFICQRVLTTTAIATTTTAICVIQKWPFVAVVAFIIFTIAKTKKQNAKIDNVLYNGRIVVIAGSRYCHCTMCDGNFLLNGRWGGRLHTFLQRLKGLSTNQQTFHSKLKINREVRD